MSAYAGSPCWTHTSFASRPCPVTIQILQSMGSESALPDTWLESKYGPHPAPAGHLSGLAHRLLSGGVLANPGAVTALRLAIAHYVFIDPRARITARGRAVLGWCGAPGRR
jgi:hypothetical protein